MWRSPCRGCSLEQGGDHHWLSAQRTPAQRSCRASRGRSRSAHRPRRPRNLVTERGLSERSPSPARLLRVLRDAWALARPYWRSGDRWVARGVLALVVALNLGIVYINVLLNRWNNTFYNALQDKDYAVFVHQLVRFCWLAGLYIVVAV